MTATVHGTTPETTVTTTLTRVKPTAAPTTPAQPLAPQLRGPFQVVTKGKAPSTATVLLEFTFPVDQHEKFIVQRMTWTEWGRMQAAQRRQSFRALIAGHIPTLSGSAAASTRAILDALLAEADFEAIPPHWHKVP